VYGRNHYGFTPLSGPVYGRNHNGFTPLSGPVYGRNHYGFTPLNGPVMGGNHCRITNVSTRHLGPKAPVQPWQNMMLRKTTHCRLWNKLRRRDLCRSRFLTPQRQDYFGRGCHLVPSCPSRKDLLWIKVVKDRLALLLCGNTPGDFVMLPMI